MTILGREQGNPGGTKDAFALQVLMFNLDCFSWEPTDSSVNGLWTWSDPHGQKTSRHHTLWSFWIPPPPVAFQWLESRTKCDTAVPTEVTPIRSRTTYECGLDWKLWSWYLLMHHDSHAHIYSLHMFWVPWEQFSCIRSEALHLLCHKILVPCTRWSWSCLFLLLSADTFALFWSLLRWKLKIISSLSRLETETTPHSDFALLLHLIFPSDEYIKCQLGDWNVAVLCFSGSLARVACVEHSWTILQQLCLKKNNCNVCCNAEELIHCAQNVCISCDAASLPVCLNRSLKSVLGVFMQSRLGNNPRTPWGLAYEFQCSTHTSGSSKINFAWECAERHANSVIAVPNYKVLKVASTHQNIFN